MKLGKDGFVDQPCLRSLHVRRQPDRDAASDPEGVHSEPWFDNGGRSRELSHEHNELSLVTIRTNEGWGCRSTYRHEERAVGVFIALI